jgi:hypothetical protein
VRTCTLIFNFNFFFKVERRGKRPWGHPRTGRVRPPRCLVRWRCDSIRSLITSRRSAGRDLGRNSAVSPAVPQPFLRRFSTQMGEKSGFEGQNLQRRTRGPLHHPHPSARRARHDNGRVTPCVRSGTSENRKNTEFSTILEMGVREAYPGRDPAVLAHGALKDTHTEHPAALGPTRRWASRRTGWWCGTQGPGSSTTLRPYCRTGVPPKFRYFKI